MKNILPMNSSRPRASGTAGAGLCSAKIVSPALALMCTVGLLCRTAHSAEKIRAPAVQGQFYTADRDELIRQVNGFLATEPSVKIDGTIRGLICPHAGYRYSGIVAGQGFSQISPGTSRVIVMGPTHHVYMRGGGSILDVSAYRNVLGQIPTAPEATELRAEHRFFGSEPRAHAREHSIEVMLPFLQQKLESFSLVPIVFGQEFDYSAAAWALSPLLDDEKTLIVASTDLSHYKSYNEARALDKDCINAILKLDTETLESKQLCGKEPVKVLVELAKMRSWSPVLIDYRNSGDTAGTRDRVVGYAAIAFTEPSDKEKQKTMKTNKKDRSMSSPDDDQDEESDLLGTDQRKYLLELARGSIVAQLEKRQLPEPGKRDGVLTDKLGCFVTLHKRGELRGCIGHIFPVYPLVKGIQSNALSAAFSDRRFPPVKRAEMSDIDIEISILTRPRELTFTDGDDLLCKLSPGKHGVVISRGNRRSTYLPQVWDQIPDKEMFLSYLCRKGGMPTDAWQDPTTKIEVYEAFVFGEKE